MMKNLLMVVLFVLCLTGMAFAAVNINTAGVQELSELTDIGPVKAAAIVDYRNAHGNFKTPDDLTKVKGIGAKTLEKLRDQITVDGE